MFTWVSLHVLGYIYYKALLHVSYRVCLHLLHVGLHVLQRYFTCVTALFYMCYMGFIHGVTWGLITRVKRFSLHGLRDVYKGYSKEEFTCLLLYSTAILLAGAVNGGSMLINSHLNKIIYLNIVSGFQRSQLAAQMSFYNFVSELISLI